MSTGVGEVLQAVSAAFRERGIRWYVFGAQAVLAHGLPRLTSDIDLTIEHEGDDNVALLELLGSIGVGPRDASFRSVLLTSRLLPLVHWASGIPIDIVLTSEGIELDFLERSVERELGGVVVPVLSAEDLIATKAVAGRRKDEEDILGVLRMQSATLRMHALRAVLAAFDAASEEPRASARFERIYSRFQRERASGD